MTRTTHQLQRWLMKEVHGIEIPRKPARRERAGPARNWRYRLWIRSLPCAVCGLEPCGEAAHTGDDGGLRQKSSDYSCIPLCSECHTMAPDSYHVLGRGAWEACHAIDAGELARRLTGDWFSERARRVA